MNTPFALFLYAVLGVISIFLPLVSNDRPVDCNNYPDGTGGYYLKCKDEHISLYTKWTRPEVLELKTATTTPVSEEGGL